MKKTIICTIVAMLAVVLTGCKGIYATFGTTPEEVHDMAVQKVSDYAEAAVNRKIEKSDTLSDEGKAKLKAEVAKLKAEILARIAAIKEKTKTGDAEK